MSSYESPWKNDELRILQDAAARFYEREFVPHTERWIEQGKVDRDAWNKAGEAGLLCSEIPEAALAPKDGNWRSGWCNRDD